MCGREFFKLLRVSTLNFEKVCAKKFFELLKSFNIQVYDLCKKVFQVFEGFLVKVLFCDI